VSTIKVRFDGRVFVPEEPVSLPVGSVFEVPLPSNENGVVQDGEAQNDFRPLAAVARIASQFPINPDSPTDLAAQHDHYLYGTPKRP
jgi:hypothetical protein